MVLEELLVVFSIGSIESEVFRDLNVCDFLLAQSLKNIGEQTNGV